METKNFIKQRRLELGLTQAEVAKMVGVSEGTISRWESGHIANMKRDRINKLAIALKIQPAELIVEDDQPAFADLLDLEEVLPPDEVRLIELYRLADEIDRQTIRSILSRYEEKSFGQSSIG